MLKSLIANVPQLTVLPNLAYSEIPMRLLNKLNDNFLWGYLSQKYTDYSVRHHTMNEQLREIYLLHESLLETRMGGERYPLDQKHYKQLFLTEQLCGAIRIIVSELIYCIYFMKQAQITNTLPQRVDISKAKEFLATNQELNTLLLKFTSFFIDVEDIKQSYGLNIIRPSHDYLLIEKEPTYCITRKDGKTLIFVLRNFIEMYNSFFESTLHILRLHSPKVIGIDLERWKS